MATDSSSSAYDAIQAWASVAAVIAGFAYVGVQRSLDSRASGRAAAHLARHSLDFVAERLDALVDRKKPFEFALRGARATEMIEVFRELELSRVPADWIESIAIIRSAVFAINSRIDEVLRDDSTRSAERRKRLYSAGRTLAKARHEMSAVRGRFAPWNRERFSIKRLSDEMTDFLDEAKQAQEAANGPAVAPAQSRRRRSRTSG